MKLSGLYILILINAFALSQAEAGLAVSPPDESQSEAAPSPPKFQQPTIAVPAPPPKPVVQRPPTAPSPPPKPTELAMTQCNPRDPKAWTSNTKVIDRALTTVIGYPHAFNKGYELVLDAAKVPNQCHMSIHSVEVNGEVAPQIIAIGCKVSLANPAKACQSGSTIHFRVDNSNPSGLLIMAGPSFELIFSQADATHWRATTPLDSSINLTLKESPVTQTGAAVR